MFRTPTSSTRYIFPPRAAQQQSLLPYSLVQATHLSTLEPFPGLPNELVHHIFYLAALSSHSFIKTLCLVSRWTRNMAVPYLLPNVLFELGKWAALSEFSNGRAMVSNPLVPATTFTQNVWYNPRRRLGSDEQTRTIAIRVFSACSNARRIALPVNCFLSLAEYGQLYEDHDLDVTLLGDSCNTLFLSDCPKFELLNRVTRLRHVDIDNHRCSIVLAAYPRLTHIAIDVDVFMYPEFDGFVARVRAVKTLEFAVFVANAFDPLDPEGMLHAPMSFKDLIAEKRQEDNRLYLWKETNSDMAYKSWVEEGNGGETIWEKARKYSQGLGF